MRDRYKFLSAIFLIFLTLVTLINTNIITVKAESDENLIGTGKWEGKFSDDASGTFTSDDSKSFTVDATSIGTGEWNITVNLTGISLKKGKTYVFNPEILSDIKRNALFVEIKDSANNIITEKQENMTKEILENNLYSVFYLITPTKDLDNVSIKFGLGYNNNEEYLSNTGKANKITVSNAVIKELENFDYEKLKYSYFGDSSTEERKHFYYYNLYNVDTPHFDTKNSKSTVAYRVTSGPIKLNSEEYEVYLNGVKTQPVMVDTDSWIHFDYEKLIYEYNVILAHAENGRSIMVIKNENVTNHRKEVMKKIEEHESVTNTEGVNNVIASYKDKLNNAKTTSEMDSVIKEFESALSLQNKKDEVLTEINKYSLESASDEVKDLIEKYTAKVSEATDEASLESLLTEFSGKVKLQIYKEQTIKDLSELVGVKYSKEVEKMFTQALSDINDAATEEQINNIFEKAKKDISNQIEKENKKDDNAIATNPVTSDNIIFYVCLLVVAILGLVYFIIKYKKDK